MEKKKYIIPIFVPHEGCPFDCIFCNQNRITGQKENKNGKTISGKIVSEMIEAYITTIPKEDAHIEVAFFGGSFTGISIDTQNELLSVAFEYKKKNIIQGIRISTRPDYINPSILENLKRFGTTVIELGVQSTDETVLKLCRRGHSRQDIIASAKLIRDYNFILGMQMMIGLPGDTYQKTINTANDIVKLKPDIVRIYPTLVIKETYLEQLYLCGKYTPLTLEEAINQSKSILILFEKNNIKVIRIGLQPTERIDEGMDVVSGPFHPAFREQVEASIRLDMLIYLFDRFDNISDISDSSDNIEIHINPAAVSETVGFRKSNIQALNDKYNIRNIKIIQNLYIGRDEIVVINGKQEQRISKKGGV